MVCIEVADYAYDSNPISLREGMYRPLFAAGLRSFLLPGVKYVTPEGSLRSNKQALLNVDAAHSRYRSVREKNP